MRQVFINGITSYLHDMKKSSFPLFPFYIGSYKFLRVKGVEDFVKDLEMFHFGEKSFARNASRGKATEHCEAVKIRFSLTRMNNCSEEKII